MQAPHKPAQNITKWKTHASQSWQTLRRSIGVWLTLSWLRSELVALPIRFHKFPAGLHRGTMTKNTKTKTICKLKQKGSQTGSEKALRQFCEQNLVRTKSWQSALTINSNITSAGRDMKKSDASGAAYWNMSLWIMMIGNVVSSSILRCCWCLLWLT